MRNYKLEMRKKLFWKYETGPDAAYPELDATSTELLALKAERQHWHEMATTFEFPVLVEPITTMISEMLEDAVMVKDVWDTMMLTSVTFASWRATLWNDIVTEEMEDGAKAFAKVRAVHLPVLSHAEWQTVPGIHKDLACMY